MPGVEAGNPEIIERVARGEILPSHEWRGGDRRHGVVRVSKGLTWSQVAATFRGQPRVGALLEARC